MLEAGTATGLGASFPEDFPDTPAHRRRACEIARRAAARQALLPLAIRGARRPAPTSPFASVAAWAAGCRDLDVDAGAETVAGYWMLRGELGRQTLQRLLAGGSGGGDRLVQQALVRVDVRMCGPGLPAEGDAVCFPLPGDVRLLPQVSGSLDDGESTSGVAATAERPVVGYVTSGGHAARWGRGVGVAFVSAVALVGLVRVTPGGARGGGRKDALVMIQTIQSQSPPHAAWARPVF